MTQLLESTIYELNLQGLNSAKNGTLSGNLTLSGTNTFPGTNTFSGVVKYTNAQAPIRALAVTTSTAANASITATAIAGGLFVHTETGAGGTATLPLGTTVSSVISGTSTGSSFEMWYINNGTAGTGTITGATGTTVVGTAAVPTGKNAVLRFYCSGTNTWNIYTSVSV